MKVYDWNESERIALVEPGRYVPMDSFDTANLTPVRECYLKQYHYVARMPYEYGLIAPSPAPFHADRWHGGVRPWEVSDAIS